MLATIVLNRKTTAILVVGSAVVMGSMFMAGLVVGLALWKPTQQDILLAKAYRQSQQAGLAATRKEVSAPPPAPLAPHAAAPTAEPVATAAAAPAPAVANAPAPPDPAPAKGVPAPAAPAPVAPVAAAKPPAAVEPAPQTAAARSGEGEYTLQVGSFRDQKNAQQLVAELKERNIQARIFKAPDSDLRMWYAVRVSLFPDLSSASRAAADFTSREQIQALVRRSRSL